MILVLQREYFPEGTNGILHLDGRNVCETIELPWKNNRSRLSCIPEGEYFLKKRYNQKYGWHLQVQNVPGRELILIHPANDAETELLDCIAPGTLQTKPSGGSSSRSAMTEITKLVFPALADDEEVKIFITS